MIALMKSYGRKPWVSLAEEVSFFDEKSNIEVSLGLQSSPSDYDSIIVTYPLNEIPMIVTGRDIDEYLPYMQHPAFLPTQQYIEVGPGCAEFIPRMVKQMGSGLQKKPIVIDPVNYADVREHLQALLDQFPDHPAVQKLHKRIQEFIDRCTILLSDNIIHIQETLGNALRLHGELLLEKADYVVSMHGPLTHCDSEFPEIDVSSLTEHLIQRKKVRFMLTKLLKKPDGQLISNL